VGVPPLNLDTSPAIEERQIDAWRRMTAAEKAAIVSGLTQAAVELSLAGIRHRFPQETDRQHFLRLALLRLGPDLARLAYPEINDLELA
jgi:hypothetical protein